MQVVPTMNDWDAPVYVYTSEDGRTLVRRDEEDPGDEWRGGRGGWTSYPHAVVLIDGAMTDFDRERQPDEWAIRWDDGTINGPYLGTPSDSTWDDADWEGYQVMRRGDDGEWEEW